MVLPLTREWIEMNLNIKELFTDLPFSLLRGSGLK